MAGRPKSRAKRNLVAAGAPSPDAFERLEQAGIECGVDPLAMQQLVTRLQGRPPSAEGRLKLDDQELLSLIDDKLARAFQNLDDFSLGQSSARDLSVTIGVLTDKRRLLKPENDTPIQRFKKMRQLDEVLLEMAKEMKRRGLLYEVTPPAAAPAENAGNEGVP